MTRLEEVETPILRLSLLALADLRRKYTDEPMVTPYAAKRDSDEFSPATERCPLCVFAHAHGDQFGDDHEGDCVCPWNWIEGHKCEEFKDEYGDEVDYDDFPIPERLIRIACWEATINEELAQRVQPE